MVTVPALYSRGTKTKPTMNTAAKLPTNNTRYVRFPANAASGTPTNVATDRDDPTIEIASAQVGMDRPPRKNSPVPDLWRLSRYAATNPIASIVARYAPRTNQSTAAKARGADGCISVGKAARSAKRKRPRKTRGRIASVDARVLLVHRSRSPAHVKASVHSGSAAR